ncbi:hypothetical protein DWG18_01260 [Lysobacter sp. TY2-98]|uniref:hypothetical protein n=1 Tax=Lysobacter sp. TY2-98 TaxID=2290922 RepID=UPI000E208B3F|nr:hypothetical protein [Lysobacter sp. TY2-98]AXK71048.1 hypothetical protein DWG18_01260 [Lysobacter sp. TY2-98]
MHHVDGVIVQARLRAEQLTQGRDSRLLHEHMLGELLRHQEHLAELHERIDAADAEARAGLWQAFFLCYDDFIAVLERDRRETPHRQDTSSS